MDHQTYLIERFDAAHARGTLDYFSEHFRELYFLMAEAQDRHLSPGELVRAYELLWLVLP